MTSGIRLIMAIGTMSRMKLKLSFRCSVTLTGTEPGISSSV